MYFSASTIACVGSLLFASSATARPQASPPSTQPETFKLHAIPSPGSEEKFALLMGGDYLEVNTLKMDDDPDVILSAYPERPSFWGNATTKSHSKPFTLHDGIITALNGTSDYDLALTGSPGAWKDIVRTTLVAPGTGSSGFSFTGPQESLVNSANTSAIWQVIAGAAGFPFLWNQPLMNKTSFVTVLIVKA